MNICVDCQNPINTCSWEREFKPVPGWIATKTIVKVQGYLAGQTESYDIHFCPLFTPPPGYMKKQLGVAKSVIAKDVVTGEEIFYPSIKKASVEFGVTQATVRKCAGYGEILYGKALRYAEVGDQT